MQGNQAANETIHVPAAPTERNDTTPRSEETTPQVIAIATCLQATWITTLYEP